MSKKILTVIIFTGIVFSNLSCKCTCQTCRQNENGTKDCGPAVWIDRSECENMNTFDENPDNCESKCID